MSQSTSTTPAPWHVNARDPLVIHSKTGRMRLEEKGTTLYALAQVIDFEGEGAANARLIAAAPELLEALQDLLKRFHESRFNSMRNVRKDFELEVGIAAAGTAIYHALEGYDHEAK